MEGQVPITTATARLLIVPDMSQWEEKKREMENDIASLGEKFQAAFKVQFEDFEQKLEALFQKIGAAAAPGEKVLLESSTSERVPAVPDQVLSRLTEIHSTTEKILETAEAILSATTEQEE